MRGVLNTGGRRIHACLGWGVVALCLSGCGNEKENRTDQGRPKTGQESKAWKKEAPGKNPGSVPQAAAAHGPKPVVDEEAMNKRLAEEADVQQAEIDTLSNHALIQRRNQEMDALKRFQLIGYILNRAKKKKLTREETRNLAGEPDAVEAETDLYKINYYYPFEIQTKNGLLRPAFYIFLWNAKFDAEGRCVEIGREAQEQKF